MKTLEDIKKIWKKTVIEVTNEVFDDVIKIIDKKYDQI